MKKQTWRDQPIQLSLGMFFGKVEKPRVERSCAPSVWFLATEVLGPTGLAPFLLGLALGKAGTVSHSPELHVVGQGGSAKFHEKE